MKRVGVSLGLCVVLVLCGCTVTQAEDVAAPGQGTAAQSQDGVGAASAQEGTTTAASARAAFINAQLDEEGNIVVDPVGITNEASYINYNAGGTMVQLIAIRASDGTPRVALNTCQSCSPSPRAYFQQEGDVFVCQNCGLEFAVDTVGTVEALGCNPTNLVTLEERDGKLFIAADELDSYAPAFASWEGPTN